MQLRALLKVLLKENFSLKRLFGFELRGNRGKTILISIAILYGIGALLLSFGVMFFDLGATLFPLGQIDTLLGFIYVYAIAMTAIMSLLRANVYLFQYRDYHILAPLPLKPTTVMIGKLIVMLLVMYIPTIFITLPIAFSYFYHVGVQFLPLVYYIIGLLFVPLLPITIVSFVSLLIARVSARMRHKNIITILLSLALMLAYIIFSITSVGDPETNPLLGQVGAISDLAAYYWPLAWFVKSVSTSSIVSLLLLVASHTIVFGLFILAVSRMAIKTNQLAQVTTVFQKGGAYKVISQGAFKTLVIKEFRKFIQTPMYALNSGIGLVFLLIFSLLSLFYKSGIAQMLPMLGEAGMPPSLLLMIFVGFCVAMTYTPAISLSLEGKNIWVIKSLPIEALAIVGAKIVFNLLLVVPTAMLGLLMLGFALEMNYLTLLALLGWSISFGVLTSLFGAMLNLLFPKINFSNEIEVIKQSIASLFAVFGGFLIIAINAVPLAFLTPILGEPLSIVLVMVACLLLGMLIYLFIKQNAAKFIRRI
jgi:ABC-2 type transport system permease protein